MTRFEVVTRQGQPAVKDNAKERYFRCNSEEDAISLCASLNLIESKFPGVIIERR